MNTPIIVILVIFAVVIAVNLIPISKNIEPVIVPPVVEKPKRKYKKRISKKNTIITVAPKKKPVGRPRKTVE